MAVSLVAARPNAFYDTNTSVSRTFAGGAIQVNDLLMAIGFGRSALTGPAGYTLIATSPTTPTGSQRCALWVKTAVAADASPNPAPVISISQATSGRMGLAYAVFRSTLGALQLTGTPATNGTGTSTTHTAPTVTQISPYLAFGMATNVYAGGDQNDPRLDASTDAAWTLLNTNSGGDAVNRLGYAWAPVASGAAPALVWDSTGAISNDEWSALTATFLEVVAAGVVKGINVECFLTDKSTPTPDTTGLAYKWWDDPEADEAVDTPDSTGTASVSNGVLQINLDGDTALPVDGKGLLRLTKYDGTDTELSLDQGTVLRIVDIA